MMPMPMKPPMPEAPEMEEESAPTSPLIAALEQAQKALEDAIVQATMKKREAPEPAEEAPPPVPTEEE